MVELSKIFVLVLTACLRYLK